MRSPEWAVGIPRASVAFRATLTATSNKYLRDEVPVEGLVQIGERDVDGNCVRVQFLADVPEGKHSTWVAVPDAVFEFRSRN